jgi:AraC-like DNA-binding protein
MRNFLLLIIALFCTGLSAQSYQQQQIDSLQKILSQFEGKEKLEKYASLIKKYFNTTMDTVLFQLFDDEEVEARKSGDFEQRRLHKLIRLKALHNRLKFDEIIKTAPKYLEFFRNEGKENHIDYFNIYNSFVMAFLAKNDTETAIIHTQQMYERAKELNCNAGIAIACYSMSNIYAKQLRYDEQEKILKEAIAIFQNVDEIDLASSQDAAYLVLINKLIKDNRLDEATEMMRKYEKFIQYIETKRPKIPLYNYWTTKIMYFIKSGEYDKAELYCDTLESNVATITIFNQALATCRTEIFAKQGKYDKALEMVDKAIEALIPVSSTGANTMRRKKMEILAKTGQANELLKLALHTLDASDSLYRKDLAYQLDELHIKYEVDKHVREKKYMRNYTYIASLTCILLIVFLLIWIRYSRIINLKNSGLIRKIREQDAMYSELEHRREYEQNLNTPIVDDENGEVDSNDIDTIFVRLSRLLKKRILFSDKNISRQSLASELCVSERVLYRCIKSKTGLNFTGYIAYTRLAYARQLLVNNTDALTMESIAKKAGFGSRATFYRLFKETYGLSPDEYRKSMHKTPQTDDFEENETDFEV